MVLELHHLIGIAIGIASVAGFLYLISRDWKPDRIGDDGGMKV